MNKSLLKMATAFLEDITSVERSMEINNALAFPTSSIEIGLIFIQYLLKRTSKKVLNCRRLSFSFVTNKNRTLGQAVNLSKNLLSKVMH